MSEIIVISGVAGMTGSKVADILLQKNSNCQVVGFDNFFCGSREVVEQLKKNKNFNFFEFDVCNHSQMGQLFEFVNTLDGNVKFFINCAAVVHTKHFYHPEDTFTTNVVAMRDMLQRCIENGYQRYINCSTSEVYSMESWMEGGVRESSPVRIATAEQSMRTSYATGKLLTEFFIKDAVDKGLIKGCSMRFANVYSAEELYDDHIIPHIISSLKKSNSVTLLENAKQTRRTFLNNYDSCMAVIKLLSCESALDGSVYNVGTTDEIYILDLVAKIAKIMDLNDYQIHYKDTRSADPARRLLNVDKIKDRVGWTPGVSLEQGLIDCVQNRLNRKD